jgi:hypothetical protein
MNDFENRYDHKNRDPLDNRKENLRLANNSQNCANKVKWYNNGSSKYKGVSFRKDMNCWRAKIYKNCKPISLGHFSTEELAAKAYDKAAREYFGEFTVLNFPDSLV